MPDLRARNGVSPPALMVDHLASPGTPLPKSNPVADGVDQAIAAGTEVAEQAVEKAAEGAEPFLAFPVIKQLFEGLVRWLIGILSKTGQLAINFWIYKIQGASENSALLKAQKEVEAAIASGDPDAILKAEQDFQKAQSAAVNSDGSSTPR